MREMAPDVHIVRTMKQKSRRGSYFCEETVTAMKVIRKLRSSETGVSD